MEKRTAYTGRPRERKTRRSVRIAETVARLLITVGGAGTILAVVTVFAFLVYVVFPLFQSASVLREEHVSGWQAETPIRIGLDEDRALVWGLFADGRIELVQLSTGKVIARKTPFEGPKLTAWTFDPGSNSAIFGFADGSVRTGTIRIDSKRTEPADVPAAAKDLKVGESVPIDSTLCTRSSDDHFRICELAVTLDPPQKGSSPVVLVDRTKTTTGAVEVALTIDGKLQLVKFREQTSPLGKKILRRFQYDLPQPESPTIALFVAAAGHQVYVFGKDGRMTRIDAREPSAAKVAETCRVVSAGATVTIVRALLGKETFLVGDSSGHVGAWFSANGDDPGTTDGSKFQHGHDFSWGGGAVTALAVSDRTRMAAAGFADGRVRLFYVTSERTMLDLETTDGTPIRALAIAPKDDGLVALGDGLRAWAINPRHPEITLQTVFGKVWYEGYDAPQYMWQTSGGTDLFEPKFSLMPLVFGTLKASFFSLLFAVPIALGAAVYTSEFMSPRAKSYIKPAIEAMASLPSVVLGFLAGLVFAPYVESVVPAVLASIITMPLAFLLGAYLWQLLPERIALRLDPWKFAFICLAVPVGLFAAYPVGLVMEAALFGGDLRRWIDGRAGSGVGGWVLVLFPMGAVVVSLLMGRFVNPRMRVHVASLSRPGAAILDTVRFTLGFAVTLLAVWGVAVILSFFELDSRGELMLGPYSQRNVLIVGFVMGFAIIPIIYTIAEDALSSVPDDLRAGSLAAGATRWQTAVRIVIPTAMSGLFSAIMIGTGRAVGETMIVLMATGNTPIMNWSLFTGLRTLSAAIAVQLPDEVKNSTGYRTLFLAALTLFAMTFVLNTLAELVRLRYRKRAVQL